MDRQKLKSEAKDIEAILSAARPSARGRARSAAAWLLLIAGAGAALYAAGVGRGGPQGPQYVTETAAKGDLRITVTATGTVEPTNQVEIASELSGVIRKVHVDFNDAVKAGQPLIEIDTVILNAQVARTRASLAAARANVVQAEATVVERQAQLKRTAALAGRNYASQTALDTAKAEFDRAVATLSSVKAEVDVAEAQLNETETSLSKARIYSPIDGVVLKRDAEPGQTVAASFQTTTLLTLADDLSRMELQVDIDEADIGKVREGQSATFTVEAYQERTFPARISQVRFASETVDGVVTYKAVLGFANDDLALRPGMTGTAEILIEDIKDALLAPNAAFRFKPPPEAEKPGGGLVGRLFFRIPKTPQPEAARAQGGEREVYVLDRDKPRAVKIKTGASDGRKTVIVEGDLPAGAPLITGIAEPAQ